jgi:hypothetical protein
MKVKLIPDAASPAAITAQSYDIFITLSTKKCHFFFLYPRDESGWRSDMWLRDKEPMPS